MRKLRYSYGWNFEGQPDPGSRHRQYILLPCGGKQGTERKMKNSVVRDLRLFPFNKCSCSVKEGEIHLEHYCSLMSLIYRILSPSRGRGIFARWRDGEITEMDVNQESSLQCHCRIRIEIGEIFGNARGLRIRNFENLAKCRSRIAG